MNWTALGVVLPLLVMIVIIAVLTEKNANKIKEVRKELEDFKKELEKVKASKE